MSFSRKNGQPAIDLIESIDDSDEETKDMQDENIFFTFSEQDSFALNRTKVGIDLEFEIIDMIAEVVQLSRGLITRVRDGKTIGVTKLQEDYFMYKYKS